MFSVFTSDVRVFQSGMDYELYLFSPKIPERLLIYS